MSQDDLSRASGVTKSAISRIENDALNRHPNMTTIRRLADALDVDPGWLLLGTTDELPGKELAAA